MLDNLNKAELITCVIEGASDEVMGPYKGADYWAHQWALARGKATSRFHAFWRSQGKEAGPLRNQRMLDEGKAQMVVEFPGGNGTADMVNRARRAGLKVFTVEKEETDA